jgi:hypothetical protein
VRIDIWLALSASALAILALGLAHNAARSSPPRERQT